MTDGTIGSGGPANGFNFINEASAAAAVVYKKVEGSWAPVYVSKNAPLPPGTETLIPVVQVAVWFASSAKTANMISIFGSNSCTIDMTQNQSHTAEIEYTQDGHWKITSNS
jgi:hypothetical protein